MFIRVFFRLGFSNDSPRNGDGMLTNSEKINTPYIFMYL